MKKLFGLAIAILAMFVMAVSFSACSDDDDDSSNSNTTATTTDSGSGSGTSGTGTAGSGTSGDGTATGSGTGSTSTGSIVYEGTGEVTEDSESFTVTYTVTFTTADTSFVLVTSAAGKDKKVKGMYTGNPASNGTITLQVTHKYDEGSWVEKNGSLTGSISGTTLTLTEVTGDNDTLTYTLTRK